jgi:hypothetical protein
VVRAGRCDRPAYSKRPTDPQKPRRVANLPVPDPEWQLDQWRQAVNRYEPGTPVDVTLDAVIGRLTLRLTGAKLPTGFVTKIRTLTRPRK